MTVGEALTEARYQAGLSVDELSQRTRIRETVIRSIERDDYDACGGDLYVRGYVRAIAGAVGIDAQPLIREYDMIRAGGAAGEDGPNGLVNHLGTGGPDGDRLEATALDLPPVPVRDPDATALDLSPAPKREADPTMLDVPPVPADPAETRFDLPPVTDNGSPTSLDPILAGDPAATRFDLPPVREPDLMAAGYELSPADNADPASAAEPWPPPSWSSAPSRPAAPWPEARVTGAMQGPPAGPRHGGRGSNRHVPAVAAVAVALVLAAVSLLVVHLTSGGTATGRLASSSKPRASSSATASAAPKATPTTPAAKPTVKPAPPVTSLPIAAAEAFGPDGLADGDNPQVASFAIMRNAPEPWATQWYATADFGSLKQGTGLLLDLGHVVTITSVRFNLSPFQGVNLQLKAGDGTAPGDFKTVATVTDSGGVLRLTLHQPATARYLLIWFTLLPPNGQGHFQENVSDVLVNGRA